MDRSRPIFGSALSIAVVLFVFTGRVQAFHVVTYYYVGTVSPAAAQVCGTLDETGYSSAYASEGLAVAETSPSSGVLCATLPASTTLKGNFSVEYNTQEASQVFYGTAAGPNAVAEPKYSIVGVFYAPPCSSAKSPNTVVYGNSNQLKVDNSLTHEYTESESVTLSGSATLPEVDFVPISVSGSLSYGWSASTTTGTDVAVSTSSTENYTIDGCLGVDGVNHKYDVIWIWLDPVLPYYIPPSTSSVQDILVLGVGSDGRDPITKQSSAPDVVALSVVELQNLIAVLNAHETPTPTNTGINESALQALERTWDTTWATNAGGDPGPGLVAADYQDILNADPFIADPSFNPDSSKRFTLVSGANVIYDATATPTLEQYMGNATKAVADTSGTDDQHYVSVEVSVTLGSGLTVGQAKLDYSNKWLWDTKSQSTTTNTNTQSATFNVWSPNSSYTGPDNLAVYWDTVYQTFAFYPD